MDAPTLLNAEDVFRKLVIHSIESLVQEQIYLPEDWLNLFYKDISQWVSPGFIQKHLEVIDSLSNYHRTFLANSCIRACFPELYSSLNVKQKSISIENLLIEISQNQKASIDMAGLRFIDGCWSMFFVEDQSRWNNFYWTTFMRDRKPKVVNDKFLEVNFHWLRKKNLSSLKKENYKEYQSLEEDTQWSTILKDIKRPKSKFYIRPNDCPTELRHIMIKAKEKRGKARRSQNRVIPQNKQRKFHHPSNPVPITNIIPPIPVVSTVINNEPTIPPIPVVSTVINNSWNLLNSDDNNNPNITNKSPCGLAHTLALISTQPISFSKNLVNAEDNDTLFNSFHQSTIKAVTTLVYSGISTLLTMFPIETIHPPTSPIPVVSTTGINSFHDPLSNSEYYNSEDNDTLVNSEYYNSEDNDTLVNSEHYNSEDNDTLVNSEHYNPEDNTLVNSLITSAIEDNDIFNGFPFSL